VFLDDGQTLELEGAEAELVWAKFIPAPSQTPSPDLPR
jgi:hypothetical protein